jgi:undecaprenyl diphosphate synthase
MLPRLAGHRQGVESLRRCIRACIDQGVSVLTVFAFSSENWSRPADEVSGLMDLLSLVIKREVTHLCNNQVRFHFVGDRANLSLYILEGLASAEQQTQDAVAGHPKLVLNVCFNYGGRWDIAQAAAKLVAQNRPINEAELATCMALAHVPDPDLIIRTGGEQRLSNFLLWQAAYSELLFTEKLWPEFDEAELAQAIQSYAQRQRRFGLLPEQL